MMKESKYYENAFRLLNEGKIDEDVFNAMLDQAKDFTEPDEDEPEGGYYIGMPYQYDDLYNGLQDEPF